MKTLILIALLAFSFGAKAESITLGCIVKTYDCIETPDQTKKCSWGYDLGQAGEVEIVKTGDGPTYEIWEGQMHGFIRGIFPFSVAIYQRREPNQKFNYITTVFHVNGIAISSTGQNVAEATYFEEATERGIGMRCTTDISPALSKSFSH